MPSIRPSYRPIALSKTHVARTQRGAGPVVRPGQGSKAQMRAPTASAGAPASALARAWAKSCHGMGYLAHVLLSWIALGLAFLAHAARTTSTPDLSISAAAPYPTLASIQAHLEEGGLSPPEAKAAIAHCIASTPRLVRDAGLSTQVLPGLVLSATLETWLKANGKRLTQDLVGLKTRQPSIFVASNKASFVQRFAHVQALPDGRHETHWDTTLSSEAIKGDGAKKRAHQRSHNANLATIYHNGAPILLRSARSDSPARILELLALGAAFSPNHVPYRAAIITALDAAPGKDVVTRFLGEPETDMLAQQKSAIAALFADQDELTVHYAQGVQRQIIKPLVLRSVMSAQGRNRQNRLQARAANVSAMHALWPEVAQAMKLADDAAVHALGQVMLTARTAKARKALLQDPAFVSPANELGGTPRWALDGLALHLRGTTLEGQHFLRGQDAPVEALLLMSVLDAAGRTPCVQCKSGQDRTLSLTALRAASVAQQTVNQVTAAQFVPSALQDDFVHAANSFGTGPIRDVRGVGGRVKWGFDKHGLAAHPIPRTLYRDAAADGLRRPAPPSL